MKYDWAEWGSNLYITKIRPFKYIEYFTTKNFKFSDKNNSDFFSYFCSKHRLWVLSEAVLTSTNNLYFLAEI